MALKPNSILKKDASNLALIEQIASDSSEEALELSTPTSTSKKYFKYDLPKIYSPIATTTNKNIIPTEDPEQYHITLFTPIATDTKDATRTKVVDPDASIPTMYSAHVSKVPNEVTRSKKSWVPTTALASASATPSTIPVKSYSGLNKGQLAGVIVGSVTGGLIVFYSFYVICWGRRKALRKARKEKELRELERKNARASINSLGYDNEDEKQHIHHDDNQLISLPRSQAQYDPTRIYYQTSRSDPREEFRSYYKVPLNNTSSRSSLSGGSNTSLSIHNNLEPSYDGFSPYYRPILQHQPLAFFNDNNNGSGNNMPFYAFHQSFMCAPPTIPVSNNVNPYFSPTNEMSTSFNTTSYQFNPELYNNSNPMAGFHNLQYANNNNAGSVADDSESERCASVVSSIMMLAVAENEDIESVTHGSSAAVSNVAKPCMTDKENLA